MLVSLRAATSIRSAKESLLLSEIFTALWNSLIPASKHYSAVVTDRKEAQKPPLLTAVTQDVSCPELWMRGHKTPACILKSVGIPEGPWQSSSTHRLSPAAEREADIILSSPSFSEMNGELVISCHAIILKTQTITTHFGFFLDFFSLVTEIIENSFPSLENEVWEWVWGGG